MPLSPAAHAFTVRLASQTGLNPRVIAGWVMAETSGHNTTNGPNNWLNVGSFDSGFQGGGANVWQNPLTAADATAAFLKGQAVNGIKPPLGGGAPSIRSILGTVGKGIPAQVQAIQNSGWASSHYNGALMNDVRPFLGTNFQVGQMAPGATAVPGAQPKIGAVRVPFQTTSTKLDPASIAGSFLANENAINPWNLPVPGASKVSTGPNSLLSSGVLPTSLQTTTVTHTNAVTLKAQKVLQNLAGTKTLNVHPATGAPGAKVSAMTAMARSLIGKPYVWGGGHGGWGPQSGYDCSGFVSAVLHAAGYLQAPQTTQTLPSQPGIKPGAGQFVTIYDRTNAPAGPSEDHVIIDINGSWFESGGSAATGGGGGVKHIPKPPASYLSSFNLKLHPQGL